MQFYYGPQMPLRILDEAEFWKQQEEEHTVVIRELLPNLEAKFVEALKQWENALATTHQKVVQFIESISRSGEYIPSSLHQDVLRLTEFCLRQSLDFITLCRQIKEQSKAVKDNPVAVSVLNHIIRESEYFIGIARALLSA
ncbi:DUF2935 domain-containing protein [Bacillus thermotolerans]|uniref:DUF2935 domain-containing protein n=1 Tax=Bacillus thermotolerans TaxID=1221996 RepID=A0A0F5HSJ8_BACTR|nr:DUF2935 domain-containing protein [Bacillus thermotolerans]KKB33407.1 hypothetical protein QY97_03335 [Bacillus thermotolerans]KKB33958.1 hypothetical protein QY96_00295 [Bacillus thermotolerans]KKB36349.1 hypothetical protein QY95_03213 [Bacillus thermotolerans]